MTFSAKTFIQDSLAVAVDSTRIPLKSFPEILKTKYTGDDFNYDVAEGETQNFIFRIIQWFLDGIKNIFGVEIDPDTYQILENVIYFILIAIAIYFIVRLLVGKQATSFFSKGSKEIATPHYFEDHIETIDLDNLISQALKNNNYRLAVRYLYLKSLKELSKKDIINWHSEKTNTDYINEIKTPFIKDSFKTISYLYDYIWYGENVINKTQFSKAQNIFDSLFNQISKDG